MNDIGDEILKSVRDGRFLSYIYQELRVERGEHSELSKELIKLQNEEKMDVVSAFKELKNDNNQEYNFFSMKRLFEKILPDINASVLKVMSCVMHLVDEASPDMAAGSTYIPYTGYCLSESSRPKEAIKIIETSNPQFNDLLVPTIEAGSRMDIDFYLKQAIRLTNHQDIEIRGRVILSLGRIVYPVGSPLPNQALSTLTNCLKKETDDKLIACIIKSASQLYKHNDSLEVRIVKIIDLALSKGDEYALLSASEIFGFNLNDISESCLTVLLSHLKRVKVSSKGTLRNIGYGLKELLCRKDPKKGILFVEELLVANADSISIQVFDSVIEELSSNNGLLLNRLMTRWFLKGDKVLCNAVSEIVSRGVQSNMLMEVDVNELPLTDFGHISFLAKKAIGYLFLCPVTAASIIVSLIPLTTDDKVKKVLKDLLFDLLLINYPGKVAEYVKTQTKSENGLTRAVCKDAIADLEKYKDNLNSTGEIPELYPSQAQREDHSRYFNRKWSESMKKAESGAVFLKFCSTSVLLYGRKSIHYVDGPSGRANRTEIPLHSHSTEMEFPRFEKIDPFGLNYCLTIFRAERMKV